MRKISLLSFTPRRLWRLISICATVDNLSDCFSEFSFDIAQSLCATAIFYRIMKQRRDRFGFVRAVFHRDCGNSKNVRDVRDAGLLPGLIAVRSRRVDQCFLELSRQLHSLSLESDAPLMLNSIAGKRDATRYLSAATV